MRACVRVWVCVRMVILLAVSYVPISYNCNVLSVCVRACVFVCVCVCMYVCMCVYVCVCVCVCMGGGGVMGVIFTCPIS